MSSSPYWEKVAKRTFAVLLTVILASCILAGWQWLDESGYVVHNHDTPVWIRGEWLIGEYRNCSMLNKQDPFAADQLDSFPKLFCGTADQSFDEFIEYRSSHDDQTPYHQLPVMYFGRIDRTASPYDYLWRCQRKDDSLRCLAIS